ncbi:MAG TPA: erythromycin esterase family protein [Trueperaceae bacterium]
MAADRQAVAPVSGALVDKVEPYLQKLDTDENLDPIIDRIGQARYVLLGEASHGTSEYYGWRARLSERLIREKGFSFIAVEGDWPDCYRVNRYAKGYQDAGNSAYDVLHAFARWPTWMWANWEVVSLIEWLKMHNASLPEDKRVGFYGLDVYSLWESMAAIMNYLQENDPEGLDAAKEAFMCFEPYHEDVQAYARATAIVSSSCEDEVVDLLKHLHHEDADQAEDREARFNAEQNARVLAGAEEYYRTMVRGGSTSWNLRDYHMTDTIDQLMKHHGAGAKGIIWEHNTHVGDARATDMAAGGMVNVGQLTRQRHATEGVVLVGFGSYHGSVIAGESWDAPMQRMPLPEARPGSWEAVLHETGTKQALFLTENMLDPDFLRRRGHRAVGVVYQPEYEFLGNYVPTVLPERYDAFIYIDETEGLHPLHLQTDEQQEPETFPWGV